MASSNSSCVSMIVNDDDDNEPANIATATDHARTFLTQEQQDIVDSCLPRHPSSPSAANKHLVRITAAAGAGKTTVLLELAAHAASGLVGVVNPSSCSGFCHDHITYVTFSKAAARDGKRRLLERIRRQQEQQQQANPNPNGTRNGNQNHHNRPVTVDAMTLHSCAQRALKEYYQRLLDDDNHCHDDQLHHPARQFLTQRLQSEKALLEWMDQTCDAELTQFLRECQDHICHEETHLANSRKPITPAELQQRIQTRVARARRRVVELIYKTLEKQFCCRRWSLSEFQVRTDSEGKENTHRVYYPCKLFHREPKKRGKQKEPTEESTTTEKEKDKDAPDPQPVSTVGTRMGFVHPKYTDDEKIGHWYADRACQVWNAGMEQGKRSFSFEMKRAQLLQLKIPGSLLLVDEAQDMDECQTDWVATTQAELHKTQTYVVGDAAQSIYAFRGAKSQYLMELFPTMDMQLTTTWRFGQNICSIANVALFAKEHSIQSRPKHNRLHRKWHYKYWIPYRVKVGESAAAGSSSKRDEGTLYPPNSLLTEWKTMRPITVLACKNATLIQVVFESFLKDFDPNEEAEDGDDAVFVSQSQGDEAGLWEGLETHNDETASCGRDSLEDDNEYQVEEPEDEDDYVSREAVKTPPSSKYPSSLPKIHVNCGGSKGGNSHGFHSILKRVEKLFELYQKRENKDIRMKLDTSLFPEFKDMHVTWYEFCEECRDFEYNKYFSSIGVITKFKDETMVVIDKFKTFVLDRNFPSSEADVILSTVHAAKGMEWDNVQVCEDFNRVAVYDAKGIRYERLGPGQFRSTSKDHYQFAIGDSDNDINKLYVAVTRAKKVLAVPERLTKVMNDMDKVHRWACKKTDGSLWDIPFPALDIDDSKTKGKLCKHMDQGLTFNKDLVVPFREEQELSAGQSSMDIFAKDTPIATTSIPVTPSSHSTQQKPAVVTPPVGEHSETPQRDREQTQPSRAKRRLPFGGDQEEVTRIPKTPKRPKKTAERSKQSRRKSKSMMISSSSCRQRTLDSFLKPKPK